jgi:hypothetical protein
MRTARDFRKFKARALRSRKFRRWGQGGDRKLFFAYREAPLVTERKPGYHEHEAIERHYSPAELGKTWGLSPETIRGLFEKESGVLIVASKAPGKRRYRTFRIPEHVVIRVHTRMSS